MAEPARKLTFTFAEYLAREQASETKHEYANGEIYALAGGTPEHGLMAVNVASVLRGQLVDRRCRVYNSDVRVRILATGLATYPDISVVCGRLERDPEDENSILNPVALVEVLSPSSEAYDRGEKFAHYQTIPSLREYVLVSYQRRRVEVLRRNDDGTWTLYDVRESGVAELASIGCSLPLDEVYRGVFDGGRGRGGLSGKRSCRHPRSSRRAPRRGR
ncbi:Uma2 family endonuclease [Sorangium sp. So ce136]|uniref:Uma2 family endonuclease n=1 Tax=Sorangium sp. So ce136 TaxID=3133284 RepID=UPI003F11770E